ncbi:putative secreted protein [Legionella massiliensis]|uniref:Putative secreted protein n=1 Tax=Legionella massiliensis TaxID=1034943 RepID=A0A078KX24_9GAMM|nr:spore coat U domain-containing protein [Legionella massiliensis]CDZ78960.1 putative secreted protein [Legionella massiliensis]CEE14698.1 Spore Coat Protein U domain protein [Legionella massiliensis]
MQLKLIVFFILGLFSTLSQATCIGVGCSCTVTSTPVAFASYNPTSATATTGTGTVTVTCTALVANLNVAYQIALSAGSNGTFSARKMISGSTLLQYNLYTDSGYTTVWGDGSSGTSVVNDSYTLLLLAVIRNYPVYGKIPGSQVAGAGVYNDTITVTVTY